MPTLGPTVSATGIVAPSYADILAQLRIAFWRIYGTDANLDPDSQDGQWLAAIAEAIYDAGQAAIAVYNQFSPATAQGAGLSSVVKINGLAREVPSRSSAVVTLTGQAGTTINQGVVGDDAGLNTRWALPDVVVIPISGEVDVTATCEVDGAVTAGAGTLSVILTPTRGWQASTNAAEATVGAPVETDAQLRARQSRSTALPAEAIVEGIYGAVANLGGVQRLTIYENDTDSTDGDGIPSHSIAAVVEGGDADEVAQTIADKKPPGTGTAGTTEVVTHDSRGVPNTIRFYVLSDVQLDVQVSITAQEGYVSTTGDALKQAVVDFVNGLAIGEDSYTTRLYTPANLGGAGLGATFVVTDIQQARHGDPLSGADVAIAFNEAAAATIDNVSLVVT